MIQPSFPELMPETSWQPPDHFPEISSEKFWSIDVETKDPYLRSRGPGTLRKDSFICGVAIQVDGFSGYYPVRHQIGNNFAPNVVFEWLHDQVKLFHGQLYGANLLYDEEQLWFENVRFHDDVKRRDVQIVEPLLDEETAEGYSLEVLSHKYLGVGKNEDLLREAASRFTKGYRDKKSKRPIAFDPKADLYAMDPAYVGQYAEVDVDNPRRIYEKQSKIVEEQGLQNILELESSLIPILLRMRIQGVAVDLEHAEKLRNLMTNEIDRYSAQIKKLVGFEPNVDSGPDMAKAYGILHFKMPELNIESRLVHTAVGNPSFVAAWYETQPDPLSRFVLRKKKLMTLRDDFVAGDILKEHVNGRIHAQFHQLRQDDRGTRSGRFSSTNPNLQQVPSRHSGCDEDCPRDCTVHVWGRDDPNWAEEVRKIFVADNGKQFCKADISQQEPRLLVHFASKAKLRGADIAVAAFRSDPRTDYHSLTTKIVNDVSGKNFKRKRIKSVNLGISYGAGVKKVAAMLGVSIPEATEILADYHAALPFVKALSAMAMNVAQTRGYIVTLLGRRRRFNTWEPVPESKEERQFKQKGLPLEQARARWPNRRLQRFGVHKAGNSLIQGSAADQTKEAMRQLYYDYHHVAHLQVHDELASSVDGADEARTIKRIMENCVQLDIPVLCDVGLGPSWGDAKEKISL
jgi:DNA polymerase I-like protein with 3'-5' exonuclease and polymerase domains